MPGKTASVFVYSRPSGYWYAIARNPATGDQISDASGYTRGEAIANLRGKFTMIGVAIKSIVDRDPYAAEESEAARLDRDINRLRESAAKERTERKLGRYRGVRPYGKRDV